MPTNTPPQPATNASPLLVVAAWAVVTLPTLWGLSYTVRNAMKLFTHQPAAAAPANPGPVTPTR